ncbi:two-component sensor histidine kinase [Amycolatopsis balhimycina DSM 5908]|uniref:histidine kinase n=1 Tax=Amycolatopsis balhimycina DSM 5908 TaxID=1081091 RepID=A0A428WRS5_AMYBA|nr:histidine kinase [Amycolatopsis balhimycina]RSM45782.1 two-component sensor histidine kinase [Amycolatopsis balhimycina DSM 5908]
MNRTQALLADAGLLALAALDAGFNQPGRAWEIGTAVLAVAALLLRRRWPVAAFALTLPALALVGSVIATLIALYAVALRYSNRYLLTGCGILAAAGYLFPGLEYQYPRADLVLTGIYATMTAAAPIFFGRLVHAQRELALRLEDIRAAREHERLLDAQATLAKERNQLAREMHDVVSHQVSLIAVQAGALSVSTTDPGVKSVADNVRTLSVDTLDELRHMVNLLRASGSTATELTPQPTLSDLDRLITGSGIETRLTGTAPDGIDTAVQRTIYRTIQEALTNVRKHAPGSTATIELAHDDTDFTVAVTNTPPTRPTLALPSARHGLVGIQERAALLGGTVKAAATGDGGFRLELRLPRTNPSR